MQSSAAKFLLCLVLLGGLFVAVKPVGAVSTTWPLPENFWQNLLPGYSFPSSSPLIIPVVTPPPMPVATIKPTLTPTTNPTVRPSSTPAATPKPTVVQSAPPSSSVQAYIMKAINDYRAKYGLAAVKTDSYTCNFAKVRAQEISSSFNHNGFTSRVNSQTLPYPGYHYVNENIAMNYSYQNVVNAWANSPGHAVNMRSDTPYVCVEKYGSYYAYEGWRP
jgi:uncharacterized protein YkwD